MGGFFQTPANVIHKCMIKKYTCNSYKSLDSLLGGKGGLFF